LKGEFFMLKCYTTGSEPEMEEVAQTRDRLRKAIMQIGGEQTDRLLSDLLTLETRVYCQGVIVGNEEANSETLPYLPARRLVEMIEQEIITEKEALAALDEKRARLRRDRESPEARAA